MRPLGDAENEIFACWGRDLERRTDVACHFGIEGGKDDFAVLETRYGGVAGADDEIADGTWDGGGLFPGDGIATGSLRIWMRHPGRGI
jgi:hypothetical protein